MKENVTESFISILKEHTARYPLMEPQDYGKLIYQSEFGPEHMIDDKQSACSYLLEEYSSLPFNSQPLSPENIGGGICRFPLSACPSVQAAEILANLFVLTAKQPRQKQNSLSQKLEQAVRLDIPGMREWALQWQEKGCPAVHHSDAYRRAYNPHYRLLRKEYAEYFPIFTKILEVGKLTPTGKSTLIAIDGRCGSGKTSLARLISQLFPCNVLHMDDFYLPPSKRQANWNTIPGGNMDFARFRQEALLPVKSGSEVLYRPYDCQKGAMAMSCRLRPQPYTIIEGSYSHHPLLAEWYDYKLFLTCPGQVQEDRLREREGSYFNTFRELWIPLEEHYFRHYDIEAKSDLVVDTSI